MNKKYVKPIVIGIIAILMIIFIILIYKNLFAGTNNDRYEGIENYVLTKQEKEEVKKVFEEVEEINNISVYKNNDGKSRIINIMIELKEDVDFDKMKDLANKSIQSFSEENLSYYDLQIFIKSLKEDSEVYPQIGYKSKNKDVFSW